MGNTNEVLGWNPNDQLRRPKHTFSKDVKSSFLIMIKSVHTPQVLFGFSSYFAILFIKSESYFIGQVDFLELPETPEITENFTKVAKYLANFKKVLIMFRKNLTSKSSKNKISRGFRVSEYALLQKMKTRKCRKSTESFLNQKSTKC